MDSPFDHVCDSVVREGDYVRTLSVTEQQIYDNKQDVIQKRAAAYLRDTTPSKKKQASTTTKAKLNTSAPVKMGGASILGGQSSGYTSSSSVGERLGIDMGSVDSCWHSLTAGTWLGYKDTPICFGTVLSVNVPNKLVLVSIWREGDTAFTHIKKPLKMFELHTLKKLSGQEFSKECKRKVVNRLQQELRMRQDGMEVGAPFALTTFNNRVVNELLDTALGGEEEWESQRISGILQSLGRIKDEHGSTMSANDTNQRSHLAHSPYNTRDVADGLTRSALASRGGSATFSPSSGGVGGGGVPSKRGARLGGSSRAHSALSSDRPGSRLSGTGSRNSTSKEAPRRPLRMKDIRRIPPRGPAAYLNDPLPIIQPIADPFHSIRRSATEFANAGMQIKSQLDLPYTHSEEEDDDDEGGGDGSNSMLHSTSAIPLPTLEHDNSGASSNSMSQPQQHHHNNNNMLLNVSRGGGGGQSIASSNLSLGESRDQTPRTGHISINMLNVNPPSSRGASPMDPSLHISRGGNSSTPRGSSPATSRLVTPRAMQVGASYPTALAPTLLSSTAASGPSYQQAEASTTTSTPSPPTGGSDTNRLNGVTSNNGMQNTLHTARYELDISLNERVRNLSSPVRLQQLDGGGLNSSSALMVADPVVVEPLKGMEAVDRIPVSKVGRLLLLEDGQEESLVPQSSQHKPKPSLSPPPATTTRPTVSCEDFGDNLSEAGSSSSSSPLLPEDSTSSVQPPPPPQFMPITSEEESILDGVVQLRDGGGNGGISLLIAPSSDSIAATKDDLFLEPFPPFEATLAFIQMWVPPPSSKMDGGASAASMPNRRRKVSMVGGGGLEDGGDGSGGGFARRVLSMDTSQRREMTSETVASRIQALLQQQHTTATTAFNPTSRGGGGGGMKVINTGLLHPTSQVLEVVLMRHPDSSFSPTNSRSRSASVSFQSRRGIGFGGDSGSESYRNTDFGASSFLGGPPLDSNRRLTVAPGIPALIDLTTLGDDAPSMSSKSVNGTILSRVESAQPTGSASRVLSTRSAPSGAISSSILQEQLVSEGLAWVRVSPALQSLAAKALPVDNSFADDTAAHNKSSTMLMRSNTILGGLTRRMSMAGGAFGQQIKNAPPPQQQQSPLTMMGRGAKAAAALRESRNGASGALPLTSNDKRIWSEYGPLLIRLLQRQREAQKERRGLWYHVHNSLNSALGGIPGGSAGAAPSLSHLLLSMGEVGAQQQHSTPDSMNSIHQRPLSAQMGRVDFHQQSSTPSKGPRLQSVLAGSASSSVSNNPLVAHHHVTTPVVTPSAQSLNTAVEEQQQQQQPTVALQQLLRSSAAGALDVLLGPQSGLPEGAAMDELFDLWEAALQS